MELPHARRRIVPSARQRPSSESRWSPAPTRVRSSSVFLWATGGQGRERAYFWAKTIHPTGLRVARRLSNAFITLIAAGLSNKRLLKRSGISVMSTR